MADWDPWADASSYTAVKCEDCELFYCQCGENWDDPDDEDDNG